MHTHPHIYNSKDKNDIIQYNLWKEKSKISKYYNNALYTWTIRDTKKRNVAKLNKLNYLEIFSYDINTIIIEFEKYINNLKR